MDKYVIFTKIVTKYKQTIEKIEKKSIFGTRIIEKVKRTEYLADNGEVAIKMDDIVWIQQDSSNYPDIFRVISRNNGYAEVRINDNNLKMLLESMGCVVYK